MQHALGLIETRGLVAAIEAADAMVKAAKVKFLGRQKVKAGLVAVMARAKLRQHTVAIRRHDRM